MKYKTRVLPDLEGLENKVGLLINVLEGNKPMTKGELINILRDIQKTLQRDVDLLDLEIDEVLLRTSPNLI